MPTANISVLADTEEGVFVGEARVGEEAFEALICIRTSSEGRIAEVHLIDQSLDLYGQEITIEIKQKIRDLIPFTDHESMREAMQNDLLLARRFFSST